MLTILIIAAIGFWFYGKHRLKRVVVKADHVTPFDKMGPQPIEQTSLTASLKKSGQLK
ncbi:hypothetical protein [Weissella cibaria]|uniref:hypothetical protein n=1 Tax=Weissella cibaria TaxID=137591 RepID=UPI001646C6DB|nr:hypothetical protein [Weissella cibaria]